MLRILPILFTIILISGCSRERIIYNETTSEFERVKDKPPIVVSDNLSTNPFMDEWVTYNKHREQLRREIIKDNHEI
jgi:hypothetical protein